MSNAISLSIDGMTCGHCVASVERVLRSLPEVESATVAVGSAGVALSLDATPGVATTAVISALNEAGYPSRLREAVQTAGRAASSCCSPRPAQAGPAVGTLVAALERHEPDAMARASTKSVDGATKSSWRVTELTSSADASI